MSNNSPPVDPVIQAPLEMARKVAAKFGFELNPDTTQLHRLTKHLADNKANFGKYYCPCKQHFPVQPDVDPICPCGTFREEVARQGHCECHLFYSPEAAERARNRPGLLAGVTCPG